MKIDLDTFNPLDPDFVRVPYAILREIRDTRPVLYVKPLNMYMVTSYELIKTVMTNPSLFSSMLSIRNTVSEKAEKIINEEGYGRDLPALQNNDPPAHTVLRQIVNKAFRPRRIRQIEDHIDNVSRELIEEIVRGGDTTEAIKCFAQPIPMILISEQVGVPKEEYKMFKAWCDAWMIEVAAPASEEELIAAAPLVVQLQRFLATRIEERRAIPFEDVLSDLVTARAEDGSALSVPQILSIVEQLLVAGNETTGAAIGLGLHLLAQDPALQTRLREAPERIPDFVEELLRMESPLQSILRRTVKDTELAGVFLPEGSVVITHFGAANRDPDRFENPDEFDLDRKGAHLAFGTGIHHCVGSELARVEMRSAFRTFLSRFSEFALLEPETNYRTSFMFRSLTRLPLRLKIA